MIRRAPAYVIIILMLAVFGCSRRADSPSVSVPSAVVKHYTLGMDGIRYWHCTDSANLRYPYNGRDSVVYFNDTFGYTVSNDSVIKRVYSSSHTDSFIYQSTDSAAGTHYFTGTYMSGGWTVNTGIWYHWADNSIRQKTSGSGPGSTYMGQYEKITSVTP